MCETLCPLFCNCGSRRIPATLVRNLATQGTCHWFLPKSQAASFIGMQHCQGVPVDRIPPHHALSGHRFLYLACPSTSVLCVSPSHQAFPTTLTMSVAPSSPADGDSALLQATDVSASLRQLLRLLPRHGLALAEVGGSHPL